LQATPTGRIGSISVETNKIGETAGAIWETLSRLGPLNFSLLMDQVPAPQSVFFMAIGWLAREDKLAFEYADGDYGVSLK
jgi:Winged helix-turn-helix domain (DUF2582)